MTQETFSIGRRTITAFFDQDDTRAAVAEVSQGANGALHIKMHDKIAAIDKLARALGMYQRRADVFAKGQPNVAAIIYEGRPENALLAETMGGDGDKSD